FIRVHPAPKFTCSGCSGSAEALDLAQAPAGAPLYSYSKRTYSGSLAWNAPPTPVWGRLVRMTVEVSPPYSGATNKVSMNPIGQFHGFTIKADGSVFDYVPVVNLSMAGPRIVTPTAVNGQKSGDANLSVPEPVWFSETITPHMNTNISSE